jgi:hypothetical protein
MFEQGEILRHPQQLGMGFEGQLGLMAQPALLLVPLEEGMAWR